MYTIVFAFVQVWCTSLSGYGMWPNPIGNGNIPAWQPPTSLRKIETRIPGWRHAAHTCVFYWSASIRALLWHDFWILISILPYHAQRQHSFHFSKKARVVTWHIHTHTLYSCCSYCRRRIINLSFRLAFFFCFLARFVCKIGSKWCASYRLLTTEIGLMWIRRGLWFE